MRTTPRAFFTAALTAALVLAVPLSASAHVHVDPDQSEPGADDLRLTFTVPNESASAVTTGVSIGLPTATPLADVAYLPVPGWTARIVQGTLPKPAKVDGTTVTEAPLRVEWTADDGAAAIRAGQIQEFVITAGPIPDVATLAFPTAQTYSDGTVVTWDQVTPSSGAEPEHPVPTLYVTATAPDHTASSGGDGPVVALSVAALVVALGALILVVSGRRRSTR